MFARILTVGICATMVLVGTTAAQGDMTFLASNEYILYRGNPDQGFASFEFDIKIRAMHYDAAADTTYAFSDHGVGDPTMVYRIENPVSGIPALTPYASLSRLYGTAALTDDGLCGFSSDALYYIDLEDPANPIETYVGNTGVANIGASAYDPTTDTLYIMGFTTNSLYIVNQETAAVELVGSLGISSEGLGGDWYDGEIYLLAQNISTNRLELGKVDQTTGEFFAQSVLANDSRNVATGLVVLPEPSASMLLGALLAGMSIFRRR